jgi:hypothetical protein
MADIEFYANFLHENMKLIAIVLGICMVLIALIILLIIKSLKSKIRANRNENMTQFAYKNRFNVLDKINGEQLINKSIQPLKDEKEVVYDNIFKTKRDNHNYLMYDCRYLVGFKAPYVKFHQTIIQVELNNNNIPDFFLNTKTLNNLRNRFSLINMSKPFIPKDEIESIEKNKTIVKSVLNDKIKDYLNKNNVKLIIECSNNYLCFYNLHELISENFFLNRLNIIQDIINLIDIPNNNN